MLYIIAGIGFAADKTHIFTQNDANKVIDLVFNIVLPIAIINTFMNMEYTTENVKDLFIAFLCSIATHLVSIFISAIVFRKRKNKLERGLYRYATVMSNAAFLALPLAQSVIGDKGVFYCSAYVGIFNIFAFTYGIYEISGHTAKMNFRKIILNPGTISVLIGIPLFLLQLNFPKFITYPMELVGNINSPLAMIIFGTFLAHANFKQLFTKKDLYLVSFLKLIVVPLVMMFVFRICGVNGSLLVAMTISASAPTATNTAMYSSKYENDPVTASELVAQSSVLSIVTMAPLVALAYII